jgi:hypothetical protein
MLRFAYFDSERIFESGKIRDGTAVAPMAKVEMD